MPPFLSAEHKPGVVPLVHLLMFSTNAAKCKNLTLKSISFYTSNLETAGVCFLNIHNGYYINK
jgi:hypothetical protein